MNESEIAQGKRALFALFKSYCTSLSDYKRRLIVNEIFPKLLKLQEKKALQHEPVTTEEIFKMFQTHTQRKPVHYKPLRSTTKTMRLFTEQSQHPQTGGGWK